MNMPRPRSAPLAALHPAQQHGAEHHALLPGRRRQHPRPRQMEQAGDTDAEQPRLATQTLAPGLRAALWRTSSMSLPSPCTSCRPNGSVGSSMSPSIVAEERFMLLLTDTQARLRHVVAVWHRRQRCLAVAEKDRLHFFAGPRPARCGPWRCDGTAASRPPAHWPGLAHTPDASAVPD